MPPAIETLWRQALKTFAGRKSEDFKLCQQNFDKLKELLNQITAEDVGIDKKVLNYVRYQCAPMCVMDLFENDDITIAIFILRHGITLPMHDHPGMHGLLKVLTGIVKIKAYTVHNEEEKKSGELIATKHPSVIVQSQDEPCMLTPTEKNLHEIECIDGPAAFLDVISPPYIADVYGDGPRPCTFFKQTSIINKTTDEVKLAVMRSPKDFSSIRLNYQGPPLR